jgi:hypothetical protein
MSISGSTTVPTSGVSPVPATFHDDIAEFRRRIGGEVITHSDGGYDVARSAWNLTVDQHPALIVVADTVADVATSVRFARANSLRVAIQATGHGVARPADGALLIVTSRLTDVTIDPLTRTAYVSCGARWSAVLEPAQRHGLAPLLGSSSGVGAVGYTLGGGMGWLARQFGLASDSVIAFEIVTPDGIETRASAAEQPELFWALKGGGAGSLGVVVGMEIRLFPVGLVYAGSLLYPAELARDVLVRWRDWVAGMSPELTSSVALVNFPPIDEIPEPLRGKSFVVVRGCWSGDLDTGRELIDGWRSWRAPAIDMFDTMPFSAVDTISNDPLDPMPVMVTTEWAATLSDELADILMCVTAPAHGRQPLVMSAEIRHAGGAIRDLGVGAVNRAGRSDEFLIAMGGLVTSPDAGIALEAALRHTRCRLAPHVTGATYLNFTEGRERQDRSPSAFGAEHYARLGAVKAALDPAARFCHGVNVA